MKVPYISLIQLISRVASAPIEIAKNYLAKISRNCWSDSHQQPLKRNVVTNWPIMDIAESNHPYL